MKNILILGLLSIGVFFCCFIIINKYNDKQNQLEKDKKSKQRISSAYMKTQQKYNNRQIREGMLLYTIDGKKIPLSDKLGKVALCIPDGVCNICYENFYKDFNKANKVVNNSMMIIVPKLRMREVLAEIKNNNYDIPADNVYGVDKELLGSDLTESYIPFMFYLDKDLMIKDLYLINKLEPTASISYLKDLQKKYFD